MSNDRKPRNTDDILLRLPSDMVAQIDALRREAPDLPSRQEIIRRVLADYLDERFGPTDR